MTGAPDGPVVVGVSLEGRSDSAVRWAATEATFTMAPPPCFCMIGMTCFIAK